VEKKESGVEPKTSATASRGEYKILVMAANPIPTLSSSLSNGFVEGFG